MSTLVSGHLRNGGAILTAPLEPVTVTCKCGVSFEQEGRVEIYCSEPCRKIAKAKRDKAAYEKRKRLAAKRRAS